jgi:purine-binding chemotaxis protein CheW
VLVVATASRWCALSIAHVVETMRPLPIEPIAGTRAFVLGLAIVRGAPMPVVDLATLLGGTRGEIRRFVTLDLGGRRAALAVTDVVGVRTLSVAQLAEWPPLLGSADSGSVEALGMLDHALLAVLRTAGVIDAATSTSVEDAS